MVAKSFEKRYVMLAWQIEHKLNDPNHIGYNTHSSVNDLPSGCERA
jgi:hypothetical protein